MLAPVLIPIMFIVAVTYTSSGGGGGHGLLLPQSFGNGGGMATVICGVCDDHMTPLGHNIFRNGGGVAIVISGVYGGHHPIPPSSLKNGLGWP